VTLQRNVLSQFLLAFLYITDVMYKPVYENLSYTLLYKVLHRKTL